MCFHQYVITARAQQGPLTEGNTSVNMVVPKLFSQDHQFQSPFAQPRNGLVVIVSEDEETVEALEPVCAFLGLKVAIVAGATDVATVLAEERPMALIAQVEGKEQDGFHTMKQVSRYNRDLPIMLLTNGDPAMMGAADAIRDLWGLTAMTATSAFPMAGQIVAFLFNAGRRAGCMRLVPV